MSKTEKENLFFEGGIAIMQGINADIKTIGDLGDIKKQIGEKFKKNIKQNTKKLEQLKYRFGISVFSITISFPLGLVLTTYLGF